MLIKTSKNRLRIAVQKKGRLNTESMVLLERCGLKLHANKDSLYCHCENLAIDLLFVRDDDIPGLVRNNLCDVGIVGENVLLEQQLQNTHQAHSIIEQNLGFGRCRLSIAFPAEKNYQSIADLQGLRIASSYPHLLADFLKKQTIAAEITTISGSVEIAPRLDMADAICDLVSTGRTLEENNLVEVLCVMQSQAVLIRAPQALAAEKMATLDLLLRRINGVQQAQESKYIVFHAPKSALIAIKNILPGVETPTIMHLEGMSDKVAVHLVSSEGVFWDTLEKLKAAGASSILVLPIEKMLN